VSSELADLYGDQVLKKIENRKEKFIDELTQIGNRKFLEETVPKFLDQEKRTEKNATILMLDIDHFKFVNDTHGHSAGDTALQNITQIIKQSIRNSDFVFRYGGEKFTVFLPNTDISQAEMVAEKIRENVANAGIYKRTISIGCMSTDQLDNWKEDQSQLDMRELMDDLIKKADRALYFSKENGRNQVNVYSKELEERRKKSKIKSESNK